MRLEGTEEVHFASKAVDVRDGEAPDLIAANFYSLSRLWTATPHDSSVGRRCSRQVSMKNNETVLAA